MGWWLEIEASTEQAVADVRERLNLAATPPADKTYVAMATKHGDRDADQCAKLVFDS